MRVESNALKPESLDLLGHVFAKRETSLKVSFFDLGVLFVQGSSNELVWAIPEAPRGLGRLG